MTKKLAPMPAGLNDPSAADEFAFIGVTVMLLSHQPRQPPLRR